MTTQALELQNNELDLAITHVDDIGTEIAEIAGPDGLSPAMIPTITVPREHDEWAMPDGTITETIGGVILNWDVSRAYYAKTYSPGNDDPPDCSSRDGIEGVGTPGGACATCKLNEWGSSKISDGAKACSERRLVYILEPHALMPMIVQVPPGSLKAFTTYALQMINVGGAKYGHVTNFTIDRASGYSQIKFARGETLNPTQTAAVKEYASNLLGFLSAKS